MHLSPPAYRRLALKLLSALALAAGFILAAAFFNHAGPRNAFLGDSLTERWSFPRANLGIHGQTSAQILARATVQLPGHDYRRVFILAGTNDILLHVDPAITLANLDALATLAQRNGIEPVFSEAPPIYYDNGRFQPAVRTLNAGIVQLAAARHLQLVDYYDALDGHPSGFSDGIHMRRRNYLRMEFALLHTANPF